MGHQTPDGGSLRRVWLRRAELKGRRPSEVILRVGSGGSVLRRGFWTLLPRHGSLLMRGNAPHPRPGDVIVILLGSMSSLRLEVAAWSSPYSSRSATFGRTSRASKCVDL